MNDGAESWIFAYHAFKDVAYISSYQFNSALHKHIADVDAF